MRVDATVVHVVRDTWRRLLECDTEELAAMKKKQKNFSPVCIDVLCKGGREGDEESESKGTGAG